MSFFFSSWHHCSNGLAQNPEKYAAASTVKYLFLFKNRISLLIVFSIFTIAKHSYFLIFINWFLNLLDMILTSLQSLMLFSPLFCLINYLTYQGSVVCIAIVFSNKLSQYLYTSFFLYLVEYNSMKLVFFKHLNSLLSN